MCGRFTLRTPAAVLIEQFDLAIAERQISLFEPRYNIAPTQPITVIRANHDARRSIASLRWGLIPSWAKQPGGGPPQINARSETLAEKPTFRTAFRRRRCLIPADGFYEWQAADGTRGKKQPFFIHRPDHQPFAFAGLWETWTDRRGELSEGEQPLTLESCTIITTSANLRLRELHDRMPVILGKNDYATWLDPANEDTAELARLLAPCPDDELIAEPVSTHVNRVANDDARCIAVQRALFD